jgi:hypothetical protein
MHMGIKTANLEKVNWLVLSSYLLLCLLVDTCLRFQQYRSREGFNFTPSHFKDFPRFAKIRQDHAKICRDLPILAKFCQYLPIFAKAVAPTGVSGVDG